MPRRQLAAVVLLTVIPLPLLSVAAMVVPLPALLDRATAQFMSIVAPSLEDGALVRERVGASRPVEITYRTSESLPLSGRAEQARAGLLPSVRGTPEKGALSEAATLAGATDTDTWPGQPDVGAGEDPGGQSPPGSGEGSHGDGGAGDAATPHGNPGTGSNADPTPPSPPGSQDGGAVSGGGTGTHAGGIGSGKSGAADGPGGDPQNPPQKPDPPAEPGGGPPADAGQNGSGPGSGNASPPETPPGGGSSSDGHGRP